MCFRRREAVDEIEDHEVDADARTEEVSYTTTAIHVKSHYLIAFLRASKVFKLNQAAAKT